MYNFQYENPTKVYFGSDQYSNLVSELKKYGNKVLLTYGKSSIKKIGLYDKIMTLLNDAGMEVIELSGIDPNPRIETVREGSELCKSAGIDVILAVGGGSTIDCSKFIAAGAKVDNDPWDFFTGAKAITEALPIVTILTLTATGSEMNAGGVISNQEKNLKLGSGGYPLFPKASFLDPENTYSVSEYQTACGSVDIMSHVMEVYFNPNLTMGFVDGFMEDILRTVVKYAPIAVSDPKNYEARANLMWAGSWAINGFIRSSATQAWTCHPIEHEISAYYDITHGLGLAIITPVWLEYILDNTTEARIAQLGKNVFNLSDETSVNETAKLTIAKLREFFFKTLGLDEKLSKLNIDDSHFDAMAKSVVRNGDLLGFKTLKQNDIYNILKNCL